MLRTATLLIAVLVVNGIWQILARRRVRAGLLSLRAAREAQSQ